MSAADLEKRLRRWRGGADAFFRWIDDVRPMIPSYRGGYEPFVPVDFQIHELERALDPRHRTVVLCWPRRHSKTLCAALIAAAMECGAVMADAGDTERERIHRVGELAGRAFQIIDDVLDIETDEKTLGKTPGKDVRDGKLTYPSVAGIENSREKARSLNQKAKEGLAQWPAARILDQLLDLMVDRRA